MKLLPNLNPLRFLLASLVMLFHIPQFFENRNLPFYNNLPIFHKGTEAVYVFFVLSGFLIIRLLYLEKTKTSKINIRNFYMRRILRILPLYILVLFSGLLYYNVFLKFIGIPYQTTNVLETTFLCLFFLPNVAAKLYHPGGIIEVLWSIGIEEQFYLLVAPLLTFIKSNFYIKALLWFTILYYFLFVSNLFPFLKHFDFLYFYFSFGGFVAVLNEKYNISKYLNTYFKLGLLICFIGYLTTNLFNYLPTNMYHLVGMLLLSFFILSISHNPLFTIQNKSLNYLGKISYGIYMTHPIIMQLIGFVLLKTSSKHLISDNLTIITSFILVITLTIITSHFSYQYFEKYFLNLKTKYRTT